MVMRIDGMKNRQRINARLLFKIYVKALCIIAILNSAAYAACIEPDPIDLPAALFTVSELEENSRLFSEYSELTLNYLKCLRQDGPTEPIQSREGNDPALDEDYQKAVHTLQTTTKKWNSIYGRYVKNSG